MMRMLFSLKAHIKPLVKTGICVALIKRHMSLTAGVFDQQHKKRRKIMCFDRQTQHTNRLYFWRAPLVQASMYRQCQHSSPVATRYLLILLQLSMVDTANLAQLAFVVRVLERAVR